MGEKLALASAMHALSPQRPAFPTRPNLSTPSVLWSMAVLRSLDETSWNALIGALSPDRLGLSTAELSSEALSQARLHAWGCLGNL